VPSPRAPRMSLTDEAYTLLRARIVRCDLAPGVRVTARGLCADLDLGITPVREALARLDHERLVLTMPRQGYLVAPLTTRSAAETIDVWAVLAPALAELAVRRATPEQGERIASYLDPSWSSLPEPGDDGLFTSERRSRGWRLMAIAGGNEVLADTHLTIDGLLVRISTLLYDLPGRPPDVVAPDWHGLFRSRDTARALDEVRAYTASLAADVERLLDRVDPWAVLTPGTAADLPSGP